ncbi:hypothetical protein GJ744_007197 [Endocarpon pusillum]|uniref:ATP synthase subunit g n=1 Tax=Endocarpon pusillum TaxID=364733 RepID=A0A8H7AJ76_9EURO|nr:hypothetical protein GJ744_007197 [Endocarpon pusillum]
MSPARAILRQTRFLLRRNNLRQASTTSEVATKAKETASQTTSKASEGLSKVTSSAGGIIGSAASRAQNVMSRVGGRTGRLVSFVQTLIPPTVYYARVGLELSKLVFQGQKMSLPSLSHVQSYLQPVINVARDPKSLLSRASSTSNYINPETILSNVRNTNRQQLISLSVIGAEVLGFFTVGTMIGRMKIVGYHGQPSHEH